MNENYSYRITWSHDDGEFVGLCAEFPSLADSRLHRMKRFPASESLWPTLSSTCRKPQPKGLGRVLIKA